MSRKGIGDKSQHWTTGTSSFDDGRTGYPDLSEDRRKSKKTSDRRRLETELDASQHGRFESHEEGWEDKGRMDEEDRRSSGRVYFPCEEDGLIGKSQSEHSRSYDAGVAIPTRSFDLKTLSIEFFDRNEKTVAVMKENLCGIKNIHVTTGANIFSHPVDAIVSPSNAYGMLSGGFDKVVADYFRRVDLQGELRKVLEKDYDGEMVVGDAVIIPTHDRHIPFIIFAPTMRFVENISDTLNVFQCFRGVLRAIRIHNATAGPERMIRSIRSTSLGTGVGKMPAKQSVDQIKEAYRRCALGDFPSNFPEFKEADGDMCPSLRRSTRKPSPASHGPMRHASVRSPKFPPQKNAFEEDLHDPSQPSSAPPPSHAIANDSPIERDYRFHSLSPTHPSVFCERRYPL